MSYTVLLVLYWDNAKENGNYYIELYKKGFQRNSAIVQVSL